MTELMVTHRPLFLNEAPWDLSEAALADLDQLTKSLQTHLNQINHLRLTPQAFIEMLEEQQELNPTPLSLWSVHAGERIVGFAVSHWDRHPVISNLVIDSQLRGQGIGKRLITSIRASLPRMAFKLYCLKADTRAVAFYQSVDGFTDQDHQSRYSHLMILPPLYPLKRSQYVVPRKSAMGSQSQELDFGEFEPG